MNKQILEVDPTFPRGCMDTLWGVVQFGFEPVHMLESVRSPLGEGDAPDGTEEIVSKDADLSAFPQACVILRQPIVCNRFFL